MPLNSKITIDRWNRLMRAFGFSKNLIVYDKVIAAYSEKHRAYHTLEHIDACFHHLDAVLSETERPNEIELALWFHDVIYKPFSGTNEEDSAELAREFLVGNEANADCIDRVYSLIILTKAHLTPETEDAKIMLDIDLSILGASTKVYQQFEIDIRKEYKRVPSFIFRKKRKEILQNFFERPSIYNTSYFHDRLERQAKQNLAMAIEAL